MLIINADDYGSSRLATDNIVASFTRGGITSTSAMVFMEDSQRAAEIAKEYGIDVGLHLNLTQGIVQPISNQLFLSHHNRIVRYLTASKYNFLIYNHALRREFDYVFHVQYEEYERIFSAAPTHIDGHHHMHLCANMIIRKLMPKGQIIRRNFTFAPGEKNRLDRAYRAFIDRILKRGYLITDFLFSLSERLKMGKLYNDLNLARAFNVELQTHPEHEVEFQWLNKHTNIQEVCGLEKGNFSLLKKSLIDKQALRT